MAKAKAVEKVVFHIERPQTATVVVRIRGTAPLLVHAWSKKAIGIMLSNQMARKGSAKAGKEPRNPDEDVQEARYISDEGWDGFPAAAFKASMVGACRMVSGLPMTVAKRLLLVRADGYSSKQGKDLVRIEGTWERHDDVARNDNGGADLRFRPLFRKWSATLTIDYNPALITAQQVINLLALAGMYEGIGEKRPSAPHSATGDMGTWEIEEEGHDGQ